MYSRTGPDSDRQNLACRPIQNGNEWKNSLAQIAASSSVRTQMIVDDSQDDAETGAVSLIYKVAERIRYPVKLCWSEQVDSIVAPLRQY